MFIAIFRRILIIWPLTYSLSPVRPHPVVSGEAWQGSHSQECWTEEGSPFIAQLETAIRNKNKKKTAVKTLRKFNDVISHFTVKGKSAPNLIDFGWSGSGLVVFHFKSSKVRAHLRWRFYPQKRMCPPWASRIVPVVWNRCQRREMVEGWTPNAFASLPHL